VSAQHAQPQRRPAAKQAGGSPLGRWLERTDAPRAPYLQALVAVATATGVGFLLFDLVDLANLVMVFLVAVVLVAARLGKGPSVLAAVAAVAAFVYFFVPHYNSFVLADLAYLPTFLTMLAVGLVVATLTARLRDEALATDARERRSLALYELSRDLTAADDRHAVAAVAERHVQRVRGGRCWLVFDHGDTLAACGSAAAPPLGDDDAAARSVRGAREEHVPPHWATPLVFGGECIGALVCDEASGEPGPAERQLLASFANTLAIAWHRLIVEEQANAARQSVEQERLRNVLLSSVSHDLRTPLASITGAVTTLLDGSAPLDEATRRDLMESIRDDADALERQVRNMLDLTRLESGSIAAAREMHSLEEIVGCALAMAGAALADRPVQVSLPADLPLLHLDADLMARLLVNLLENACRHTPAGSPVRIAAALHGNHLQLAVEDHGPGVPASEREAIFSKFQRGAHSQHTLGAGLGLAICRAIASLHGGAVRVDDRPGGGARFVVDLPHVAVLTVPTESADAAAPEATP
jgi:two-component system sensor histidine kinase KdpD